MRIDGQAIAKNILNDIKKKNIAPHLAIVLIGDDPASKIYVQQKIFKAKEIGIKTTLVNLKSGIQNPELIKTIEQLNNNDAIHGIIVQRPLPLHINSELVDRAIDPKKDVDSFNSNSKFDSPISMAILAILEYIFISNIKNNQNFINWLKNKSVCVIGKGETGGRPIIKTLKKLGVQPLIVDTKTNCPENLTKDADIIISSVGKPNVLNAKMIKKDAILISIGLHKGQDGKLHGDYEENEIKNIASFYTPSPGGVGPINVTMLLKNVATAADSLI